MKLLLGLIAVMGLCSLSGAQPPQAAKPMRDWVDQDRTEPAGTHYKLFHSKIINGDYSYLVYLPPDYDSAPQKRYPSVYWLHRFDGDQRNGARFVELLDSAIRRGKAPAMIVFLLNGLGESCWTDSKDGKYPVESVITKEMIPYFDQTYRTIPRREARAIEGMSMGGYGALRLGFSHNDLFGVVSALAPGLISEQDQPPQRIPPAVFENVMGRDDEYFHATTAWTAAGQKADKIGRNTLIRIVVGDKDTTVYERSRAYGDLLKKLQVPFQFVVVPGVKHSYPDLYATLGDEAFVFYQRAMAQNALGSNTQGPNAQELRRRKMQAYAKEHPPRDSVGLAPLTDLGEGNYLGEQGGLYPGGVNTPPAAHRKAGLKIAKSVVPLDRDGQKAKDGKVVLLCIGFSNPTMEFQTFLKHAAEEKDLNPSLVPVDGCVGGQAANVIADPKSNYWKVVDQRLAAAGVTPNQVQAIWMKQVLPQPKLPFPGEPKRLQAAIEDGLQTAHDRFPNLKLTYLTSRIYAGYTAADGSPEPWAYETGFAVKWAVADQLAGKPELNYDAAKGAVRAPWIVWGPYIWTDGMKGRKDGLIFKREDLGEDGMHPSLSGRGKVATLLMDFLKNEPTSKPWFVKKKN